MMVARVRVYHSIVNIRKRFLSKDALSGQRMHGHSIVFPHDSPEVCSLAVLLDMIQHLQSEKEKKDLMEKFCDDLISIQFLGPDQDIDFMIKKFLEEHLSLVVHLYFISGCLSFKKPHGLDT